ncbi:MAG: ribosomal protein S18-alanine N-acetyltransferase [Clostridia bacterium]|nr:ribosomal protein S18-alanine N-acetyltransferase [Clostridia bacterium]
MRSEHLDDVLAIERLSFPTPWSRYAFESELKNNRYSCYIVCLLSGRVIGYAGSWIIEDEAHITTLAVDPRYRGQGLGKALLSEITSRCQARGAERITLEVRPSNKIAQRLYENMGFIRVGIRRGYYTDTREDAIIMWRNLNFSPTSR